MATHETQRDHGAVEVGHARPQRDQHVHVGGAATQRLDRAVVKIAPNPELDGRSQRPEQPVDPSLVRPVTEQADIAAHAQHEQRQGEQRPDDDAAQVVLNLGLARRSFGVLQGVFALRLHHAVARLLDGADERLAGDARCKRDQSVLAGEVDLHIEHAVHFLQRPLDIGRAVHAVHAGHGQVYRLLRHVVAGFADAADNIARPQQGVIVDKADLLAGEVDVGLVHTVQLAHVALDGGDAVGASHAGDWQRQSLLRHRFLGSTPRHAERAGEMSLSAGAYRAMPLPTPSRAWMTLSSVRRADS